MSTEILNYGDHQVRHVVDENCNPWFVAKDVCAVLDIPWTGRQTLDKIPDSWTSVRKFLTQAGFRDLVTINEPGVYKLAFRSNKPEADRFTNWVASEVLPAIRKNGAYIGSTYGGSATVPQKEATDFLRMLSEMTCHLECDCENRLVYIDGPIRIESNVKPIRVVTKPRVDRPVEPPQEKLPEPEPVKPKPEPKYLSVTEMAKYFGCSARTVNLALDVMGFCKKEGLGWKPTERGKPWCTKHGGSNVYLHWHPRIQDILENEAGALLN